MGEGSETSSAGNPNEIRRGLRYSPDYNAEADNESYSSKNPQILSSNLSGPTMKFLKEISYKGIKFTLRKQCGSSAIYSARTKFGICTIHQERFLDGDSAYSGYHVNLGEPRSLSFSAAVREEMLFLRFLQEEKNKDKKLKANRKRLAALVASAKSKLTKTEWSALKELR